MTDRHDSDSWGEWQSHILAELTDLKRGNYHVLEKLSRLEIEIAVLKIKSGLWGAFAGLGTALGVVIIHYLFGGK